jgi:hypothetical protein
VGSASDNLPCRPLAAAAHCEAPVMLRQIFLYQITIDFFYTGDLLQAHLLDQPILVCAVFPFTALWPEASWG